MRSLEFLDLVAGYDERYLADYLQISLATFRRWKSGQSNPPHAALLLLSLKLRGDLAVIGGEGWDGFTIDRTSKLYVPYFHRGFTPDAIKAMFFNVQELRHLRGEVKRLNGKLWVVEKMRDLLGQNVNRPASNMCYRRVISRKR